MIILRKHLITYQQSLFIISSSASRIKFSTSSNTNQSNFQFPKHSYPTPFEIFHLPKTANTLEIKSRYYQLVKLYHPDLTLSSIYKNHQNQKNSLNESTDQFKRIVEAYELLKSSSKRQLYLNSGQGWTRSSSSSNRASRNPKSSSNYSDRPYRTFYPSSLWDWTNQSNRFTSNHDDHDWFNSSRFHYQTNSSSSTTFKEQWQRDGLFTKNGIFISSLGCIGLMFYCFQVWKVIPLLDHQNYQDSNQAFNLIQKGSEPIGDKRLDQEAWYQLTLSNPSSSPSKSITTQPSIDSSSLSFENTVSYPHPLAPCLFSNTFMTNSYHYPIFELASRSSHNMYFETKFGLDHKKSSELIPI